MLVTPITVVLQCTCCETLGKASGGPVLCVCGSSPHALPRVCVCAAAIQAVLEGSRGWRDMGICLRLVPPAVPSPGAAASATPAGPAGAAPSLLFQALGEASPFLTLSLAPRTAQLSLSATPAWRAVWGSQQEQSGAGVTAGGEASDLVAAAQQGLQRAQRDALSLPLAAAPSSVAAALQGREGVGARGLLLAGLAGAELETLCRRLAARQRLAAAAAALRQLGLIHTLPLPLRLLKVCRPPGGPPPIHP